MGVKIFIESKVNQRFTRIGETSNGRNHYRDYDRLKFPTLRRLRLCLASSPWVRSGSAGCASQVIIYFNSIIVIIIIVIISLWRLPGLFWVNHFSDHRDLRRVIRVGVEEVSIKSLSIVRNFAPKSTSLWFPLEVGQRRTHTALFSLDVKIEFELEYFWYSPNR